jgi:phosphoribosylformylglycinamidine synthase
VGASLLALLAHPNIASKHWIIRQYDHEVQGNVVAKPLVGPASRGPGDAAIIEPIAGSNRGIAVSQGLQTPVGDPALGGDAYLMVLAAVDEVVRNLVCVGADPDRTAILDNFCWPSCAEPRNLASLVRAAEGCYDAAKAYRTPFVSGKDSLNNQLRFKDDSGVERVIEIPPTLLVTGLGILPAVDRAVTMDAKAPGNTLLLVGGPTTADMGASHYALLHGPDAASRAGSPAIPRVDLAAGPAAARAVARLIQTGLVASAHDCSEGGGRAALGADLRPATGPLSAEAFAFAENPSRYVLEVRTADLPKVRTALAGTTVTELGAVNTSGRLTWAAAGVDCPVEDLFRAWHAPLDW